MIEVKIEPINLIAGTYEGAERFLNSHREFDERTPIELDDIVENFEISSSDEVENNNEEIINLGNPTIAEWFRIKNEKKLLEKTVVNLNKRIGTEVLSSDDDSDGGKIVPRFKPPIDTQNLQHDFEFVPRLLFRAKVMRKNIC